MKLGVSCSPEYWSLLREIGYDYAEGYFAKLALDDEDEFRKLCERRASAEIDVEVFNGFFASNVELYAKDRAKNEADIANYAEKGFFRAKILGASLAVIGSGKARTIPLDMEREETEERFLSILRILGDMAKRYEMRLAIEPLSHAETNLIGTVAEGHRFAMRTGCENVGTMIDLFHAFSNGDSLDSLKTAKDTLFHVHIARPASDRRVPTEFDNVACMDLAKALKDIGYKDRISLEAVFGANMERDLRDAYAVMQIFRDE